MSLCEVLGIEEAAVGSSLLFFKVFLRRAFDLQLFSYKCRYVVADRCFTFNF